MGDAPEQFDAWGAMRAAANQLHDDPDMLHALTVFIDYWGMDCYTPPAGVEKNVRDLVQVFAYAAKTSVPDALADRDATIAALRAELERWRRVGASHLDIAEDDLAEIARLRAGITALAEAGPERRSGPGPRLCYHGRSLSDDCGSCYSEALLARLDPQAPGAGEGRA